MIEGIMVAAVIICVYTVVMQHITFGKRIDQLNKAFDRSQEPIEPIMVEAEELTEEEKQKINDIIEMIQREADDIK